MKPIYLEFCGLNSFSETASVDFNKLLQGGVFGIFGDTGSGKSTILDAIHFALYGKVDRASNSAVDCINHRVDKMRVLFEFELTQDGGRRTYRIERERRRKNAVTKAYLYEIVDSKILAVAEGTRDVDLAIGEIVGLTFEDFKTCIALPQGDFAKLVKAQPSDRVKLVARLFNLEKYGDKLYQTVAQKQRSAETEAKLIEAKMGESVRLTEENQKELEERLASERADAEAEKKALLRADEKFREIEAIKKQKTDYDTLTAKIERLYAQFTEMEQKRKRVEGLPVAKRITEQAQTLINLTQEKNALLIEEKQIRLTGEETKRKLEEAKAEIASKNYEAKIVKINLDIEKHEALRQEVAQVERAEKELKACQAEYRVLISKCPEEDFDKKQTDIETEIASLGDDEDLLGYIKRHFKGVVLGDTYEEVRADLKELADKHPATQEDILPLLKKYTLTASTEGLDFAQANIAFKEIEKKKKGLVKELETLKKRRLDFEANEREKQSVKNRGERLRKDYETAKAKITALNELPTKEELIKSLDDLKKEQSSKETALEKLREKQTEATAKTAQITTLLAENEKAFIQGEKALALSVEEYGVGVEEASLTVKLVGDEKKAKEETDEFFETLHKCVAQKQNFDEGKIVAYNESVYESAKAEKERLTERVNESNRRIGATELALQDIREKLAKKKELEKELQAKQKYADLCDELKKLLHGNKFLEFVASEYLQEICASASDTLSHLTGGRYYLRYEEKEFKVADNFDGGNLRAVRTLSGGETFLVSLSLALALSKAICLKSLRPIEFFFLDEGFGTLDGKLVETVMDTLGKLGKDFSIGLISHVEELKRRIERKILVAPATERSGSTLRTVIY